MNLLGSVCDECVDEATLQINNANAQDVTNAPVCPLSCDAHTDIDAHNHTKQRYIMQTRKTIQTYHGCPLSYVAPM
jgi:hypothetical protein